MPSGPVSGVAAAGLGAGTGAGGGDVRRTLSGGGRRPLDPVAHVLGPRERQEGEGDIGVLAAGGLDDDLGQAEQLREERPTDLDGLDALHGHLPLLPEQPALAELDMTA